MAGAPNKRRFPAKSMTESTPQNAAAGFRIPPSGKGLTILLLAIAFLHVAFRLDTRIIFDSYRTLIAGTFPTFNTGSAFFFESLRNPGGPVEYLGALFSQLYHFRLAGALLLALMAWLIYHPSRRFLAQTKAMAATWPAWIPPLLFLIIQNRYSPYLHTVLALAVVLWGAMFYARFPASSQLRITAFLVVSPVVYFLTNGAYVFFALLCGMLEIVRNRRIGTGVFLLALAALFPWMMGSWIYDLSLADCYIRLIHFHPDLPTRQWLLLAAALAVPALMLVAPLGKRLARLGKYPLGVKIGFVCIFAVLLSVTVDTDRRRLLRIHHLALTHQWEELLEEALELPRRGNTAVVLPDVNRALYYRGNLLQSMFTYPQSLRSFVISMYPDQYIRLSPTLLELGRVNDAERIANEDLVAHGDHPQTLKTMVKIHLTKGRIEAAKLVLHVLARNPVHGTWARSRLRDMESDPRLDADAEIQRLRTNLLRADRTQNPYPEELFTQLLKENPRNRMAFEYLMCLYLITKQLDKVAENLPRLRDFGYKDIPRHCAEAMMIYNTQQRGKADWAGFSKPPSVAANFRSFSQLLASRGPGAIPALRKAFAGTYFFYFKAARPGGKK